MTENNGHRIAIAGGGLSGLLVSYWTVRSYLEAGGSAPLAIDLYNPAGTMPGLGVAYSVENPRVRLTLMATGMSVRESEHLGGDYFATGSRHAHLATADYPEFTPESRMPRAHFADTYLGPIYNELLEMVREHPQIVYNEITAGVADIVKGEDGRNRIIAAGAEMPAADEVVLATGFPWKVRFPAAAESPHFFANPYDEGGLRQTVREIARQEGGSGRPLGITIAGSMNSGIDGAIILHDIIHQEGFAHLPWEIAMVSPSGSTLEVHDLGGLPSYKRQILRLDNFRGHGTIGGEMLAEYLQAELELAEAHNYPAWAVYTSFGVDELQGFWNRMAPESKHNFYQLMLNSWNRLDTGLDPSIDADLKTMLALPEGQAGVRLVPIAAGVNNSFIHIRDDAGFSMQLVRNTWEGQVLIPHQTHALVDCTGPGTAIDNPLIARLEEKGMVMLDAIGRGLAVGNGYAVSSRQGWDPSIRAIGPLLNGELTPMAHYAFMIGRDANALGGNLGRNASLPAWLHEFPGLHYHQDGRGVEAARA